MECTEKSFMLWFFFRIVSNICLFFFYGRIYMFFTLLTWCFCRVQTGHDLCRDLMARLNRSLMYIVYCSFQSFFVCRIDILGIVFFSPSPLSKGHLNLDDYFWEVIKIILKVKRTAVLPDHHTAYWTRFSYFVLRYKKSI